MSAPADISDRRALLRYKIEEVRREVINIFNSLTEEQLKIPTSNEGWTVYDLCCHIAGAGSGMEAIAQRILKGESSMVEGFDINRYNSGNIRRRQGKAIAELIEELNQSRARMNVILTEISEEQLDLPGEHPTVGKVTLYGLFVVIYRHERQHIQEIREAVAAAGKQGE
jgi:hypothetical protein